MTNKPEKTDHTILTGDEWTVPAENGVGRRTLVQATAWTIPVVASAVATPAFAASLSPTLEFTSDSYAADACGTLSGVQVRLTTDGTAPDAGKTVTVAPPAGFTWTDGTTTPRSFTTDANGIALVDDMVAPSENGSFTISATSGSLSASAPITVSGATATIYTMDGLAFPALDDGVTVERFEDTAANVNRSTFLLGSNGILYRSNDRGDWSEVGQNVTDFAANNNANGGVYVSNNTVFGMAPANTFPATPPGVTISDVQDSQQSDGTRYTYIVSTTGDLYYSQDRGTWTLITSGVSSLSANDNAGGGVYVKDNQVHGLLGVPFGATPTGVTIDSVEDTTNGSGSRVTLLYGTDGSLWSHNANTSSWTKAEDNVTDYATNNNANGGVYVTGNRVYRLSKAAFAVTPAGKTIADVQDSSNSTNPATTGRLTVILTTDGTLYRYNTSTGAWTTVAEGVTDVQLNHNRAAGVYAVPAC